jgi:hypothetical protein
MGMKEVFHTNPDMVSAISPYVGRFQRFVFQSKSITQIVNPHKLTASSFSVEMIAIVARKANTDSVYIWNENLVVGMGWSLSAGDSFVQTLDNFTWDMAEALTHVMGQIFIGQCVVKNSLPRRTFDTSQWFIMPGSGTQLVDICFGLGPANE